MGFLFCFKSGIRTGSERALWAKSAKGAEASGRGVTATEGSGANPTGYTSSVTLHPISLLTTVGSDIFLCSTANICIVSGTPAA